MKLTLKPVKTFEVFTAAGVSLGVFKVSSEWESMVKLMAADSSASIIVDTPSAWSELFSSIFNLGQIEVAVIKISPSIAAAIAEKTP